MHNDTKVVCLCGSTKFVEAFATAQFEETMKGNIVLTIGCNMRTDKDILGSLGFQERFNVKRMLDSLHFRKIEIADEVFILNVGGYIGLSTCDELHYAMALGKDVRFLEESNDCCPLCPNCGSTNTELTGIGAGYQEADASRGLPEIETDGMAWCKDCDYTWWE